MPLISQVTNALGNPVPYHIRSVGSEWSRWIYLDLHNPITGRIVTVGEMRFSLEADHLLIKGLYNTSLKKHQHTDTSFRGVGSVLFEYAFRQSLAHGKQGRIQLEALHTGPAAYYKMGFRILSWPGQCLKTAIDRYKANPTYSARLAIETNPAYAELAANAAENLYKTQVTFTEAIEQGLNDKRNQVLKQLLTDGHRLDEQTLCNNHLHSCMYLPDSTIAQLIKKFSQTPVKTTQKTLGFFKQKHQGLKPWSLEQRVALNQLSESNAAYISKIKQADEPERAELLLSPLGLHMLEQGYLSAEVIFNYVPRLNDVKALVSTHAENAFYLGYVPQQVVFNIGIPSLLFSDVGLQALIDGHIAVKDNSVCTPDNAVLTYTELKDLLDKATVQPDKDRWVRSLQPEL